MEIWERSHGEPPPVGVSVTVLQGYRGTRYGLSTPNRTGGQMTGPPPEESFNGDDMSDPSDNVGGHYMSLPQILAEVTVTEDKLISAQAHLTAIRESLRNAAIGLRALGLRNEAMYCEDARIAVNNSEDALLQAHQRLIESTPWIMRAKSHGTDDETGEL